MKKFLILATLIFAYRLAGAENRVGESVIVFSARSGDIKELSKVKAMVEQLDSTLRMKIFSELDSQLMRTGAQRSYGAYQRLNNVWRNYGVYERYLEKQVSELSELIDFAVERANAPREYSDEDNVEDPYITEGNRQYFILLLAKMQAKTEAYKKAITVELPELIANLRSLHQDPSLADSTRITKMVEAGVSLQSFGSDILKPASEELLQAFYLAQQNPTFQGKLPSKETPRSLSLEGYQPILPIILVFTLLSFL